METSPILLNWLNRIRIACAVLVTLLGISVLYSWHADIRSVLQINTAFIPMVYNTAICFTLSGFALLLINRKWISFIFGFVIITLSAWVLLEYFLDKNLFIDQLFMEDRITQLPSLPGRMAANSTICFIVAGSCFLLNAIKKDNSVTAIIISMLGFVILTISGIAFLNYFLPIDMTFGWETVGDMAAHTATGFIILSIGIMSFGARHYHAKGGKMLSPYSIGTLIGGTVLSVALWQYLMLNEESDIDRSVSITQDYLGQYVGDIIKQQEMILYEITFDLSRQKDFYINDTIISKVKKAYPQVNGLASVTPEKDVVWAIPLTHQDAMNDITKEVKNIPVTKEISIKSGSVPNGPKGFTILLPYYEDGIYMGTLVSVYNAEKLFNSVLSPSMLENFGVSISENGLKIYESASLNLKAKEKQWGVTTNIYIANSNWVLTTWPKMSLINEIYSWTPYVVFVVSLFLMSTLATIIQLSINMRELHKLERKASKAKSDFLSSMSHELRTPLNAIMGYAQLIEYNKTIPKDISDNAGKIRSAGRHLLSLINDILDLSKIEAGKVDISLEEISLDNIVAECYTLSKPIADKYHVALQLENFHSDVFVKADYFRLKQILINLISNAIKYNKQGGSVSIQMMKLDNNNIKIGISDTGMGMSEEQIKDLFQPFQRFSAEKSSIEGTGIGLVIAKNLINKMQGNIFVESIEGKGSTFWIELPLCKGESVANKEQHIQSEKPIIVDKETANKHIILVAEDNPANQEIIRYQLEYLGYRCDIVSNGLEACEKWVSNDYSVILMDCNMPEMNGFEAARKIRKDETHGEMHVPIVAFTANALKEDIQKCHEAGMDDYLVKPVDLELLKSKLNKYILKAEKPTVQGNSPVDFDVVKQFVGDNPAVQEKIFKKFVELCPEVIHDFDSALKNKNAEEVRAHAHKLKSSARALGAIALADLCLNLENAGKSNDWNLIESLIPNVIAAANEALTAINTRFHWNN